MPLNSVQIQTLRSAILSETAPVIVQARTPATRDDRVIAAFYNEPSTFVVWKTSVPVREIMENGFVWTSVDALTVAKARIWEWMTRYDTINPSKPNIRQGVQDCFGAGSAMVTAILPHCKRFARRVEALFTTGTGTDAVPGLLVFEGAVTLDEVSKALNG